MRNGPCAVNVDAVGRHITAVGRKAVALRSKVTPGAAYGWAQRVLCLQNVLTGDLGVCNSGQELEIVNLRAVQRILQSDDRRGRGLPLRHNELNGRR